MALFRQGDVDGAGEAAGEAIRLHPKDGHAHYILGLALGRKGISKRPSGFCKQRRSWTRAEVHRMLADAQLRLGRHAEAALNFRAALKQDAKGPDCTAAKREESTG